ncbi:hypothetical protein J3R82DRAFT_10580 [Butyriboletus roseoflavus]|nr:hypothetical protein J3R82DRAFT_10580 [Butyriboletus roseoflavus]
MGAIEGRCTPVLSGDLHAAIAFAKVIIVASPPHTHHSIIDELAKFDLSKHIITNISGTPLAPDAIQKIGTKVLLQASTTLSKCEWLGGRLQVGTINPTLHIMYYSTPLSPKISRKLIEIFSLPPTF